VDNYLPPRCSNPPRTDAPSAVQRNRARKAAFQEKNRARGNQAGIARSAPHRGRFLQGVQRLPSSVQPERPSRRHRARRLATRMTHERQTISVHHAPSPPAISTVDFESSDSTAIQAAAHRSSATHSPSRSDVFPLLASKKSPFWTLFTCTEDRQGALHRGPAGCNSCGTRTSPQSPLLTIPSRWPHAPPGIQGALFP